MSPEPDGLIVVPILLGHVGLSVVVTNITHALGLSERRMSWVTRLVAGAAVLVAALLIAAAATRPWAAWPWLLQGYGWACLAVVLVGWPLTVLVRARRRLPAGIAGSVSEVDLTRHAGREELIGTGKHSWMLHLPGNESFRLKKCEWDVTIAGFPEAWDGLSLVHVSDLHFAPCFRRRYFEAIADEAAAWEADVVAFTGDLIDHDAAIDWIVPVLSRLRGRLGTFAIMGNHDMSHEPRTIRRTLAEAGFTDIEGRWTSLEIEGRLLAVGGTAAPWGRRLDLRDSPEADFRLLLSHTPDQFAQAARWGVDLVLAGHNHAGQIRLPLVGPVFMPSLYSRHFDRGYFRSGRTLMSVSQGVAGKHPVRYGGCFPELTRLVLRAPRPSDPPGRELCTVGAGGRVQR
jgi:predicted MPP superfamily phosphohydrolase